VPEWWQPRLISCGQLSVRCITWRVSRTPKTTRHFEIPHLSTHFTVGMFWVKCGRSVWVLPTIELDVQHVSVAASQASLAAESNKSSNLRSSPPEIGLVVENAPRQTAAMPSGRIRTAWTETGNQMKQSPYHAHNTCTQKSVSSHVLSSCCRWGWWRSSFCDNHGVIIVIINEQYPFDVLTSAPPCQSPAFADN